MSIVKEFTCPSKREAKALPLLATAGLFVRVVVNENAPVGFAGLRTSRASRRITVPNLMVWRPRTIVTGLRNSVIDGVKLALAGVGWPICWYPATGKVGST